MSRAFFTVLALFAASCAQAQNFDTSAGRVVVEPVITGLDTPWAVAVLPDGNVLVTERDGRLLLARMGQGITAVAGVPAVRSARQGGLLDVVLSRDFAETGEIFLTYSAPVGGGGATSLAVAQLDQGASALVNLRVVFQQKHAATTSHHYGSRVVEAPDGTLFLTVGDRGSPGQAQDLSRHNGKVLRIARDGSIPPDNPILSEGAEGHIWSYGHRNPQGAALDLDGRLWTVEHGARGGDEVNQPLAGKNYGWPIISYGTNYNGSKIGLGTSAPGFEQPAFYWDPSMAPSGMMIYSGRLWSEWRGDIFVGSLKFNYLSRLEPGAKGPEEHLFADAFTRIRDIREAPDGTIWFIAVGDGAVYRVRPA